MKIFIFLNGTLISYKYWAWCLEEHQDHGKYYHFSLKLSGVSRLEQVKDEIIKSHNIVLNFSDLT